MFFKKSEKKFIFFVIKHQVVYETIENWMLVKKKKFQTKLVNRLGYGQGP
jgi:hypothetical protein